MHSDAEEHHFYIPLIDEDMTQQKSRHSIAEYHDIDKPLNALDNAYMSNTNWLKIAKDLQHKVLHHLEGEEREVFKLAGKVLNDK